MKNNATSAFLNFLFVYYFIKFQGDLINVKLDLR